MYPIQITQEISLANLLATFIILKTCTKLFLKTEWTFTQKKLE